MTVIGLRDLTKGALIIQSKTYQAFVPFFAIAANVSGDGAGIVLADG